MEQALPELHGELISPMELSIYILDTNVLSELMQTKPNQQVVSWLDSIPAESAGLQVLHCLRLVLA